MHQKSPTAIPNLSRNDVQGPVAVTDNASLETLTTEVAELLQNQNYHQAIDVGLSAMKRFTPTSNLLGMVGQAFYHTRDFEQAAGLLQLAVGFNPHEFLYQFYLAHSLQMQGDKINAVKHYLLANEITSKHYLDPLSNAYTLIMESQGTTIGDEILYFLETRAASDPNYMRHLLCISVLAGQLPEVKQFLESRDNQEFLSNSPFHSGLGIELRKICSVKQWALEKALSNDYQELGPPEQIPYAPLDSKGRPYIKHYVPANTPYIACLPDVSIMGRSLLVFDREEHVIADILAHPEYGRFVSMKYHECVLAHHPQALLVELPQPSLFLDEGIMLCGPTSIDFGHWFSEFLPKLPFFEKIPHFAQIAIIVDEGMPKAHYDFLKSLVPNEIVRITKSARMAVKKLWVAPTITFKPGNLLPNHGIPLEQRGGLSLQVLDYLRNKILEKSAKKTGYPRRIYISRKNLPSRKLLNEQEVITTLESIGFTTIEPEKLSFEEQIQLFRNAEIIVGPSGSALNNLIFADTSTPIFVIQTQNYDWGMAVGQFIKMGFEIRFIAGAVASDSDDKHAHFNVNVSELTAAIEAEMSEKQAVNIKKNTINKIFCIGRNEIGTNSIAEALTSLGYKLGDQAAAELLMDDWGQRDFHRLIDYCKTADAFQDVPFNLDFTYPVLDYAFPDSKFILTIHNSGSEWYESLINFHSKAFCNGRLPTADDLKAVNYREPGWLWKAHTMIYGNDESNLYHRENYIKHYEDYNARVLEYFKHRPQDLLVLNLSESDSMARLACFLGVEASDMAMPHLNAST